MTKEIVAQIDVAMIVMQTTNLLNRLNLQVLGNQLRESDWISLVSSKLFDLLLVFDSLNSQIKII